MYYQVVIVLIDSFEKGVVDVAVTKHPRLDGLESLSELDDQSLRSMREWELTSGDLSSREVGL